MSNILAALGIAQFKKIDKVVQMRRKNAKYLNEKLSKLNEIIVPTSPKNSFSVYQMYTIKMNGGRKLRDALKIYLNKRGIMAKIYFEPIHLTNFYKKTFGYKKGDLPITEEISEKVLTLPIYPSLTKEEMDYMVKAIKTFFRKYDKK